MGFGSLMTILLKFMLQINYKELFQLKSHTFNSFCDVPFPSLPINNVTFLDKQISVMK